MGILFSGGELIDIAVGIEKNGVAFYETLQEFAKDESTKSIYKRLADMEKTHIDVFEGMRAKLSKYQPEGDYSGEYDQYLRSLVNSHVFPNDKVARETARQVQNDGQALQIAIGAEKDSVLFYIEMRGLVQPADISIVDKVIAEEKSHIVELTSIRKQLTG
ncbi:MAG: ferritin family protein [Chloroflexota bacterium]|nr:ferritin family protein [Chloroflexota bacterium]